MLSRLGQVLYWAGCAVAFVIVLAGVAVTFNTSDSNAWLATALAVIVALIAWLIGRAALYVLAGK